MDPNATYKALLDEIRSGNVDDAMELAHQLCRWILAGGYIPYDLSANVGNGMGNRDRSVAYIKGMIRAVSLYATPYDESDYVDREQFFKDISN